MPIQNAEAAMPAVAAAMPTAARVRAPPWARRNSSGTSSGSAAAARAAMAVSGLIAHVGASPTRTTGLKPVCTRRGRCVHQSWMSARPSRNREAPSPDPS